MFRCNCCDKEFSSYRGLNGHKRIHNETQGSYNVNRSRTIYPTFICLNCGREETYDPRATRGKFCSNKCQGQYQWENDSLPRLMEGKAGPFVLKRYLIETFGCKCFICGVAEWNRKKLSLQLDHIDGNSDNNLPNNGRLLCPNCHSQTETFTGRNKKNAKRNQYLQKYKSEKSQKKTG